MTNEFKKRYYLIGILVRFSEYRIPAYYADSNSITTLNLGFAYIDVIINNSIFTSDGRKDYRGISWIVDSYGIGDHGTAFDCRDLLHSHSQ